MKYINADQFERDCMFDKNCEDMQDVIYKLRDYPSADVVEVVRCKDCKYNTQPDYCLYGHTHCAKRCNMPTMDDDFCSYGERKETE